MPEYRISPRAALDLDGVVEYSESRFGSKQADIYIAGLTRSFKMLAESPRRGRPADRFGAGLRQYRFEKHYIVFSVEIDHIIIRAVVHARRQPSPDLVK